MYQLGFQMFYIPDFQALTVQGKHDYMVIQ